MARRAPIASLVLALALAAAPAAPAGAAPLAYTEDFRDTLLRDPLLTTAWWDTVAGELKLPPLGAVVLGTADTPDNAFAVVLLGTHALVADNASGLQVVDVASAGQPEIVHPLERPPAAFVVSDGAHDEDLVSELREVRRAVEGSPAKEFRLPEYIPQYLAYADDPHNGSVYRQRTT